MRTLSVLLFALSTLAACDTSSGGDDNDADAGGGNDTGNADSGGSGPIGELDLPVEQAPTAPPTPSSDGIHISPSGNDDSGDGSQGSPYRSIQYVLDNIAQSGDTLTLHDGDYNEAIRIRASNITVQALPGAAPHIACPVSIDENDPILCVEIDAETTGVTLRGLEVSGGFYAIFLGSQWDYDDTPLDNLAANHVTIEDCILHDSGRDVVKIPAGCDDVTIRRCEIYNSGMGYPEGTPQDEKNAEGIDAVNADRMYIGDTYIHDTATSCAYVKGGSIGTIMERIRAERCGDLGLVLGFDTSPEFFDTSANPDYHENIGGVIRNCVVSDTGLAGIALYATRDAYVLHNTIRNAATRGQAALYLGVATQDYDPIAGRPANLRPTIVGNVVDQGDLTDLGCFGIRYTEETDLGQLRGLEGEATIDHNYYWATNGCYFDDSRPESLLEGGDFSGWQSGQSGRDATSQFSDPGIDATGHTTAGSPLIDALAEPTAGISYDIDGDMRTGAWDIGADEAP